MKLYLIRKGEYLEFKNEVARVLDHFESNFSTEEVIAEVSEKTAELVEKKVTDLNAYPEEEREIIAKLLPEIEKSLIGVGRVFND
ncbi:MAG TPA: hypothetical protein ENL40_02030 [Thermococcus litoralis]|uniref:Uncharacterized protein n=1 Tax=Thermococcus litoralis TaxID=2265 RepID=A0A7C5NWG5_THELI|nr:hypothetical protein [Thermococcus litoralis]